MEGVIRGRERKALILQAVEIPAITCGFPGGFPWLIFHFKDNAKHTRSIYLPTFLLPVLPGHYDLAHLCYGRTCA